MKIPDQNSHVTRYISRSKLSPGFTLVEILVVIAIVAVLATVCLSVSTRMKKSGLTVKELNAAKNLTNAMLLSSQDSNGTLPLAFDGTAAAFSIDGSGFKGGYISGAAAHRYPFRLAPYFGYQFEGTTVIDRKLQYTLDKRDYYAVSLMPSLGVNAYNVGGYKEEGEKEPIVGAIRQMSNAFAPERMIAFASARLAHGDLDGIVPGYHLVTPPRTPGGDWSSTYSEEIPSSWGNIDLRHNERAVVGFLDGSAGTLGKDKLKDMRLWNNEAARLNDPDHRPVVKTTGGGRGR
ncbi:MAG: type II secretion system protein [Verrucomicrobiaceae bacterium]|nr:MAG: type II secretion system protein [Verrucomicrobiaceae bacterium]